MTDEEWKNYRETWRAFAYGHSLPPCDPAMIYTDAQSFKDDSDSYHIALADAITELLHAWRSEPLLSIERAIKDLEEVFQPERDLP